jgi:putative nucleotidyltransferase with HDIG domain
MTNWTNLLTSSTDDILHWAASTAWGQAMAACEQDQGWHAEGDVWTHTHMVVRELERLPDWSTLDRPTQATLLCTALFHDAGKPATTIVNPETGRTHSPKHALVGMELARSVLRQLGCPLVQRERICQLVRYHGRPPFLFEKTDPVEEVIRLSWLVDHQLLYWFALADTRGRQTSDMTRAEETLHLWKMLAEEHQCYTEPYSFANDQARFLFYQGKLSSLHYIPQEDYRCTVTMMAGVPGVGKDTWLRQHRPELPTVSLDELRHDLDIDPTDNQGAVIQAAREACRQLLRDRRDFAFNATNTMKLTRQRWLNLFAEYGARIELIYLEPALETIHQQNARRPRPVPRAIIEKLVDKLEPPTADEAHVVRLLDL